MEEEKTRSGRKKWVTSGWKGQDGGRGREGKEVGREGGYKRSESTKGRDGGEEKN